MKAYCCLWRFLSHFSPIHSLILSLSLSLSLSCSLFYLYYYYFQHVILSCILSLSTSWPSLLLFIDSLSSNVSVSLSLSHKIPLCLLQCLLPHNLILSLSFCLVHSLPYLYSSSAIAINKALERNLSTPLKQTTFLNKKKKNRWLIVD
jgi:hypothetical protein